MALRWLVTWRPVGRWLALMLLLLAAPAAVAQEAILDLKMSVDVRKDGALEVYQRFRIRAERNLFKHGLSYDMPLGIASPNGGRVQRDISDIQVTLDGEPEPFTATEFGNILELRTGGARDLKPGEYVYELRYLTRRQIMFRDGEDEVIVPVAPYGWKVPIQDASVEINLPGGLTATRVFAATGDEDARAGQVLVRREGGKVRVQASRPLPPNNGMTVAVSWVSGAVDRPGRTEQIIILFKRFEHLIAPLSGISGLCALGIAAKILGRRKAGAAKLVPPAGYSPATIQFYQDGTTTFRGVVYTILGLATKGYLTIEENDHGEFMLQRTWRDTDLGLSKVDRAVAVAFYQNRPTRFLVNAQHATELLAARRAVGTAVAAEFEQAHIKRHPVLVSLIFALPIVAAILMVLLSAASNGFSLFPLMTLAGVAMLYLGALPSDPAWQIGKGNCSFADLFGTWATTRRGQVGLVLVALGTLVAAAKIGPLEASLILLMAAVAAWIYHGSKKIESLGNHRQARFDALRQALSDPVGSDDRVEMPVSTYESMLPYAAAWDVYAQWSERYRRINSSAAQPSQRPRWLTTPRTITEPTDVAVLVVEGLAQAIERAVIPGKR